MTPKQEKKILSRKIVPMVCFDLKKEFDKLQFVSTVATSAMGGTDMNIREIHTNKKQFLSLLLLADEQEDMIDRYLEKGTMYVLEKDDDVKAECVVTDEGAGVLELKNIAVKPQEQGKGYGRTLIDFLVRRYAGRYSILQVGTGDSLQTVPFYERCGFARSHSIPNFFTENYDHPIYEGGVQLVDMVYLQRRL